MAKIDRFNGDVQAFGSQSQGTERTVFGDVTQADTLDANITADFLRGWGIVGVNENPTKQDFNGLAFTLSQLIAYLHQRGIPEWNASQEYFEGSVVTTLAGVYRLLSGGNGTVNPDADDGTNWEKAPTRAEIDQRTIYVGSVAELAAIDGSSGQQSNLSNGGRTGVFRFNSSDLSSAVSDDPLQGVYIAPSSDPTGSSGAWVRQYGQNATMRPELNAGWFGAKGDGAENDGPSIQAALEYGESFTGPTDQINYSGFSLYLPTGIYMTESPIIVRRRGLKLRGDGRSTAIYPSLNFPADNALISSRATEDRQNSTSINFEMESFSLYGQHPESGDFTNSSDVFGMWFTGVDGFSGQCSISSVFFKGLKEGIRASALYSCAINLCVFLGGTDSSRHGTALNFDPTNQTGTVDGGTARACTVSGCTFQYLNQALLYRYGYGFSFYGNRVEQNNPAAGTYNDECVFRLKDIRGADFSGNYFEENDRALFQIGGESADDSCKTLLITKNYIQEGQSGTEDVTFRVTKSENSRIENNYFRETSGRDDFRFAGTTFFSGNRFEYRNNVDGASELDDKTGLIQEGNPVYVLGETAIGGSTEEYSKFSDGRLIVRREIDVDLTTAGANTINLVGQGFIGTPTVYGSAAAVGVDSDRIAIANLTYYSSSPSSIGVRVNEGGPKGSNTAQTIYLTAVGRWK